ERECFGDVAAVADAPGIDQADLARLAHVIQSLAGLADRGDAGHAGLFGRDVRAGPGAAFHAVDVDGVRTGLRRHADVVIDAGCTQLQLDRDLPVGRLAHLVDL